MATASYRLANNFEKQADSPTIIRLISAVSDNKIITATVLCNIQPELYLLYYITIELHIECCEKMLNYVPISPPALSFLVFKKGNGKRTDY